MRLNIVMMALRFTPLAEEEGVEVDGAEGAGGTVVSIYGRFGRSWASLCLTDVTLMAPMVGKKGELGRGIKRWRRILVIAKGKMNLSQVAVSL